MAEHPTKCRLRVHFSLAVIGALIGFSAFFIFGFKYHNWHAAVWGSLSGLLASITLFVHVQYSRDVWKTWTYQLKYFMTCGCSLMLVTITGFVVYLTLAIVFHQNLNPPFANNYYLASVWTFMSWKWSFLLFWFSRKYRNLYGDEYRLPAYEHI